MTFKIEQDAATLQVEDRYKAEQMAAREHYELRADVASAMCYADRYASKWSKACDELDTTREHAFKMEAELKKARAELAAAREEAAAARGEGRAAAFAEAKAERAELLQQLQQAVTEAAAERREAEKLRTANRKLVAEIGTIRADMAGA